MSPTHHLPSCFQRPSAADEDLRFTPHPSPAPLSGDPNVTTCLYQTHLGIFCLKWSRTFLGHYSLHLNLQPQETFSDYSSPISISSAVTFRLKVKPLTFWKKSGSRKIQTLADSTNIRVFWDLTRVKFGSGPEPRSGFYLAVIVSGEMCLLVGDCSKEAYVRSRARTQRVPQALILRREHVFGDGVFRTNSRLGGKNREICVDCRFDEDDARLSFRIDDKRVLQIKRLKWKFRGNEKIEVDGVAIQISWDVHNWFFDSSDEHAVFMFRSENEELQDDEEEKEVKNPERNGVVSWQQSPSGFGERWRKVRRRFLKSGRSSSSISMSSSSAGGSSVMEWASSSADELELAGDVAGGLGFSLLLYAWRR